MEVSKTHTHSKHTKPAVYIHNTTFLQTHEIHTTNTTENPQTTCAETEGYLWCNAQMDPSIEPYDSPDAPTIRHIPLTSTPAFPQHDGNAHVITVEIHHQRMPSPKHTTSPPQNNLKSTRIFPLQQPLQQLQTRPTASPSPPELTLQQSDMAQCITPHTSLQ